jgi:asparagine synthase (glutamine-hydrolysing)
MWAFAIWDAVKEELFLSRDRFGEKPLYYYQSGSRFAFASNLAGLRPALELCEIDPQAVASLLAYEYIPHSECIYQGVKKLSPAHSLVFSREGLRIERYWELDYRNKLDISLEQAEKLIEETLVSSVSEQLIADVPLGVFLSGGVDSGYLTALAAKIKPGVTTFTMSVPGSPDRDESASASVIAGTHSTNHVQIPLDQNCIGDLPGLLATIEPLGDSSIIPASAVSQKARSYLKVVLSGDGGDEAFDGYGMADLAHNAAEQSQSPVALLWKLAGPALVFLSRQRLTPGLRLLRIHSSGKPLLASSGMDRFIQAWEATPSQVRKALYGPRLKPLLDRQLSAFLLDELHQGKYGEWWEGLLSLGYRTRLVDDFLLKVDTATMFHSLESRSPFLDFRLVELAASLAYSVWMPDHHSKSLLKRLSAKKNPPQIVYAPKKGFSIPLEEYFLGGWGKMLIELTRDGAAAQTGLLNPTGIQRYLRAHGLRYNYRLHRQLFSILALEIWLRVFHFRSESAENLGEMLLSSIGRS